MSTLDTKQTQAATAAGTPAGPTGTPAGGSDTPTTPTTPPAAIDPQSIAAIATALDALLAQMEALVPDLRPHDPRQIARITAAARYGQQLIPPAITTVISVPSVPNGLLDPEGGRGAMAFHDQLFPIAQRGQAFVDALLFSINSIVATYGEKALQTYHWSRRAVKGPDGPSIRPYLEEMVRVVKKANNKRKVKAGSQTPAPAPQPTPGTPAPQPAPGTPAPPASGNPSGNQSLLAFRPELDDLDDDFPCSIYDLVDAEAA